MLDKRYSAKKLFNEYKFIDYKYGSNTSKKVRRSMYRSYKRTIKNSWNNYFKKLV